MSKEYLFGAPPAYVPPTSGESERDRRLRLRAEERARKLAGGEVSAYEQNEISKRDQIWEMKKMQRLAPDPVPAAKDPIPSSFPYNNFSQMPYENMYKDPERFENPSIKYKESPREGPKEENFNFLNKQPSPEYPQKPSSFTPSQEIVVSKEQDNYANNLFKDLVKKQEIDKKKQYADDLKKQMEDKRKPQDAFDQGFDLAFKGNFAFKPNVEIDPQPRRQSDQPFFGGTPTGLSEKEKKQKYARELEAQIKQRKETSIPRQSSEEYFPFPSSQDAARDKKRQYAQELEAQIKTRNQRGPDIPKYPESEKSEYFKEDVNLNSAPSIDVDRKAKYRQDLERQIEEQKRRKEEEKKKRKVEEDLHEKRFVNASGVDPNRPIVRHRTVDPNKPSEENPQADRYKFHMQKAKKGPDEENGKFNAGLQSNKADSKAYENLEQVKDFQYEGKSEILQEQRPYSGVQRPFNEGQRPFNEVQRPFSEVQRPFSEVRQDRPINEYQPAKPLNDPFSQYEAEKNYRNLANAERNHPEGLIPNQIIETYMREIQETRLERDRAREQCLEMREMMLREKERNLEQLLYLVKNQDSRPSTLQEPRPSVYSAYGAEPKVQESKPDHSQFLTDLYKDFKPDLQRPKYEQNLIDVSSPLTEEPDPFEQSLAGNSKWVDPNQVKWGAVSLIESVAVPNPLYSMPNPISNNPSVGNIPLHPAEDSRKKWELDSKDKFLESKFSSQTPRFILSNQLGSLTKIIADDESLPSKIEHIPYLNSQKGKFFEENDEKNSSNESIKEEIESDSEFSDKVELEKEIESKEIPMSSPKYQETDQYMVECDDWSDSQEDGFVELKRQAKNSYEKPKIFDVFKEKPAGKNSVKSPKKSPKKELPPNPSHGKIAFSRLEQARKHAKELKAKETTEEPESSQARFLDLQDFCKESVSQSSFEGKFTQQALNELRKKKKNNEISSSKASFPLDSKELQSRFFAAAYEKDSEEKSMPKTQSRRYID